MIVSTVHLSSLVIFLMLFSELFSVCERFKEIKKAVNYSGKELSIGKFLYVVLSNRALNHLTPGFDVRIYTKVFL